MGPPMSVDSKSVRETEISHARSLRLEFLRTSSPSMDWLLMLPSGFRIDSSTSLKVAWSLSPGMESISDAVRRLCELGAGVLAGGSSTSSSISLSSSDSISDCEPQIDSSSVSSSNVSRAASDSERWSCSSIALPESPAVSISMSDEGRGTSNPGGGGGGGASNPGGGGGISPSF